MPNPPGGGSDPGGGLYLGADDDWFGQKWSGSGGVPQFPGDQKSSPGGSFPAADFLTFLLGGQGGGELPWGGMRRRHEFQGSPLERTPMPAAPAGGGFAGGLGGALPFGGGHPGSMGGGMPYGAPQGGLGGALRGMPHYAQGGPHPGGPAVVGELGPEVVDLPAGSQVHPSHLAHMLLALLTGGAPHYAFGTGATPTKGRGWFGKGPNGAPYIPGLNGPGDPGEFSNPGTAPDPKSVLGRGQQAGVFDPLGSPKMAEMLRESIQRSSGARERAGQLGADLDSGGDPALRAYARTQARLNTQSEAANAQGNALLGSAQGAQDFLRNLYLAQFAPRQEQGGGGGGGGWEQFAPIIGAALGAL